MPSSVANLVANALMVAASAGAGHLPSEVELEVMWTRFRQTYHREYEGGPETSRRFAAFKRNVAQAQEMNLDQGIDCTDLFGSEACVFGVTKFSDLLPEEFAATRLGYKPVAHEQAESIVLSADSLPAAPDSKDWRQEGAVSKVKDQGQCGSCWAFSTVEEIESQVFMATGQLPELSTQQLISCDKVDEGCNGGDTVTAYHYIEKAGGLDTASDYPDKSHKTGKTGKCHWSKKEVVNVTGFSYATSPCKRGKCKDQDEDALAQALASKGPISICVNAGGSGWQSYKSGVFSRKCSGAAEELDHCVQLVGYNKAAKQPYWIVRNSWNSDWGVDGFMYLAMGKNLCGVADEATIAQVHTKQEIVVV